MLERNGAFGTLNLANLVFCDKIIRISEIPGRLVVLLMKVRFITLPVK